MKIFQKNDGTPISYMFYKKISIFVTFIRTTRKNAYEKAAVLYVMIEGSIFYGNFCFLIYLSLLLGWC